MSDHIEVEGRKYYEESYLVLANNNGKRRGDRIADLEAALNRLVKYVERAHVHLPSTLMKAEAMGECAAAAEVWWKGKGEHAE